MSEIARLTTALPYQLPRAASGVTEPEILGEPKDRSVLASMGATLLPMASPSAVPRLLILAIHAGHGVRALPVPVPGITGSLQSLKKSLIALWYSPCRSARLRSW